jgi:hypothetical protein
MSLAASVSPETSGSRVVKKAREPLPEAPRELAAKAPLPLISPAETWRKRSWFARATPPSAASARASVEANVRLRRARIRIVVAMQVIRSSSVVVVPAVARFT